MHRYIISLSYEFWLLQGLITTERSGVDPSVTPFAKPIGEVQRIRLHEGSDLLEVVKKVKPHVFLGLSGVGGIFNEPVRSIFTVVCPKSIAFLYKDIKNTLKFALLCPFCYKSYLVIICKHSGAYSHARLGLP
ncbi:putative malate dehydrogenase (decarboxylating) [Helianthus debilis subsp. tardiflorus]